MQIQTVLIYFPSPCWFLDSRDQTAPAWRPAHGLCRHRSRGRPPRTLLVPAAFPVSSWLAPVVLQKWNARLWVPPSVINCVAKPPMTASFSMIYGSENMFIKIKKTKANVKLHWDQTLSAPQFVKSLPLQTLLRLGKPQISQSSSGTATHQQTHKLWKPRKLICAAPTFSGSDSGTLFWNQQASLWLR